MEERKKKLEIVHMKKHYKNGDGVDDINFSVYEGEFVTMLGPSGCGKSTILRTLGGFLSVDEGDILIDGASVRDLAPEKRPTAMVFQSYNLWPHMTVADNLAFGLKIKRMDKAEIQREIQRGLALVGMTGYEKKYPGQLSGGQQQRVAIARALMTDPELLLLDEITSALDPMLVGEVLTMVAELKSQGTTILMATHEMSFAHDAADRVVLLRGGVIAENGTPREVMDESQNPETKEFFSHFRH